MITSLYVRRSGGWVPPIRADSVYGFKKYAPGKEV